MDSIQASCFQPNMALEGWQSFSPDAMIARMSMLYLLGDSTCAIKRPEARPETGWGEEFPIYLAEGWGLCNMAINGRSSRGILLEGVYYDCFWKAEEGDYVLFHFGHNEDKPEAWRFSTPGETMDNLVYMASNLMKKGVGIVLASPISRRRFKDGHALDTHGAYPDAIRQAASILDVPYIEMTRRTLGILDETGDEESKKWFMNFPAGLYDTVPEGREDNTHLRPEGAKWIAGLMAAALKEAGLPFVR